MYLLKFVRVFFEDVDNSWSNLFNVGQVQKYLLKYFLRNTMFGNLLPSSIPVILLYFTS